VPVSANSGFRRFFLTLQRQRRNSLGRSRELYRGEFKAQAEQLDFEAEEFRAMGVSCECYGDTWWNADWACAFEGGGY
jgi:hypothetical protein